MVWGFSATTYCCLGDTCKCQTPTSCSGQEEGTCFDLEGKIGRLAKSHGGSAPLDRYPEPTIVETTRNKGLASIRPLLTRTNIHTGFKIGRQQNYRQSTKSRRQHMRDARPSSYRYYHDDAKQQRQKPAAWDHLRSVKITSLTTFFFFFGDGPCFTERSSRTYDRGEGARHKTSRFPPQAPQGRTAARDTPGTPGPATAFRRGSRETTGSPRAAPARSRRASRSNPPYSVHYP